MAYYPESCDYFVENHDDHGRFCRSSLEEEEKLQRQGNIGRGLSRLASDEYRNDIAHHMAKMESATLPDVTSIEIQPEIQWYMRPYLIDFLIEAHCAFNLLPETLFLTINLLDRYCSKRTVYKRHYQLVGCASLLIAAKYGDRKEHVPTIRELKAMCCSLYEDDMFTQMEWHVLQTLGWAIGHPTIESFLQLALDGLPKDPEVEYLARYISEIAMFSRDFVSKLSSDLSRCSLALARCILARDQPLQGDWASKYDAQTLVMLSQQLHRPSSILSNKYSTNKMMRVSITLESFLAQQIPVVRYYATPPTPPSELRKATSQHGLQGTCAGAQKGQPASFNANGCLTPPITPVITDFTGHNPIIGGYRRPSTPTSLCPQSVMRRYETQYPLPPIPPSSSTFRA